MRFGIIGTNVISEWFVAACRNTGGRAAPVAVLSRDLHRARHFAASQELDHAVDSLPELFDRVDAVYVASPIAAHHGQAMAALAAGRHVLVEKTMGADAHEVEQILATAEGAGLVAMEALRSVHTPVHQLVRGALPALGTLRHARVEKMQYSSRYDAFREGAVLNAFDPTLGNSALADIGVYCLQPALDLFGEPATAHGASVWLANGFEAGGTIVLGYDGLVVDVAWSKIVTGAAPTAIHGEDAALTLDDPADTTRVLLHPRGGEASVLWEGPRQSPAASMHHEVLAFCDQVDAGAADPRWSRLTLLGRRLMDEHLRRPRP